MPQVLISGHIHADGWAVLRTRPDLEIREMTEQSAAAFIAALPEADALLIRTAPLPALAVERAERLRVVSRHGVGYDNLPMDLLTARGVPVALVGTVNAQSVAEQAIFMMMALAKRGLQLDRAVRQGAWDARNRLDTVELAGQVLLLLGFGRTGRAAARIAAGLGMRVLAHDPALADAEIAAAGATPVADWRSALGSADFISLHVPRTAETEGLIGAAELARMKPTACLVNTARGGLIDERALAEAVAAGRIAGAGLDVFEEEPPPADHPLCTLDRVILSPHIAGLTQQAAARMSVAAARNVLDGLDGRLDPLLVANPAALGGPAHP